jgi:threonyl-tRNA synthetase
MADADEKMSEVLLVMGCPEVPVQNAIASFIGYNFRKQGAHVVVAGNPSVIQLIRVSDPEGHYLDEFIILDRAIEEIVEKKRDAGTCVVFAHNDSGISYAATMRHLLPAARLVVIIFGRNADELAGLINFPCETVVEKAVHNPGMLRKKVIGVFRWAV